MGRTSELIRDPKRAWRVFVARRKGVVIGPNCRLASHVLLDRGPYPEQPGLVRLGAGTQVERGSILQAWGGLIELAENVFVGPYAVLYGHGGISIGAHTLISMQCSILSSNHAIPPAGSRIRFEPNVLLPTRAGADVWLGAGVRVLGGVTIGDGAVVGAGAVVASDLPSYSLAVGVPARVIRLRE